MNKDLLEHFAVMGIGLAGAFAGAPHGAIPAIVATELRHLAREAAMRRLDAAPNPVVGRAVDRRIVGVSVADRPAIALAFATKLWRLNVREPDANGPNGAGIIDDCIRGPLGLGWSSAEVGAGARPKWPYVRNGQFAWCGAKVARCFGEAGLRADIRRKHFASTYRLWKFAKGTPRWIRPEDIQPCDVPVVGPDGDADGAHVTFCTEVRAHGIETFEGNAMGTGPDGDRYEGVVKQYRPFAAHAKTARTYRVIFGFRPLPEDYIV